MSPSPVLVLSAEEQRRAPFSHAYADLANGLRLVSLWGAMGWFDIRQRYSRSVIGPFWVTLSLAGLVGALGLTYGALLKQPLGEFLPFLTLGMLVWTFMASILTDGCNVFVASEAAIKQMPGPLSIHVYRVVWRALIILGHNALVAAIVLMFHPLTALIGLVPALIGLAIVTLNGVAISLTLGTLGARFRDLPPLMLNITSLAFFVSPILWRAENLGDRAWIAYWNPAYYMVELVRAPLLGEPLSAKTWAAALVVTALNGAVAFLIYARFRWRIPYWL